MFTKMLRAAKSLFARKTETKAARPNSRRRLSLECLEERDCTATYTVTGLGDAGVGMGLAGDLRYCIAQANANAGSDWIQFQQGLQGTIDIISEFSISDDLIVGGPGADLLEIRRSTDPGTAQFRLFDIVNGADLFISELSFANGSAVGNGGAFRNTGYLTIQYCNLTGNVASGAGGAIYNDLGGELYVGNCNFSANGALDGGAIASEGDYVEIHGGAMTYNNADVQGGAIYIREGRLWIDGGSIYLNWSGLFGGGIFLEAGTWCSIYGDAWIHQNTVLSNQGCGGGIWVRGELTVTDAVISNNMADTGGGVFMDGPASAYFSSTVSIDSNSAPNGGDGISYDAYQSQLVNDAVMVMNTADPRF